MKPDRQSGLITWTPKEDSHLQVFKIQVFVRAGRDAKALAQEILEVQLTRKPAEESKSVTRLDPNGQKTARFTDLDLDRDGAVDEREQGIRSPMPRFAHRPSAAFESTADRRTFAEAIRARREQRIRCPTERMYRCSCRAGNEGTICCCAAATRLRFSRAVPPATLPQNGAVPARGLLVRQTSSWARSRWQPLTLAMESTTI